MSSVYSVSPLVTEQFMGEDVHGGYRDRPGMLIPVGDLYDL